MSKKQHLLILSGRDSSIEPLAHFDVSATLFQEHTLLSEQQIRSVERLVVISPERSKEIMTIARQIHAVHPFDAVVSFYETWLEHASCIAEELGIRGNKLRPVVLTRNKASLREFLGDSGLPVVRFARCANEADLEQFRRTLAPHPIIAKPVQGAGSSGVHFIRDAQDVPRAWSLIANVPEWMRQVEHPVLAEEFIDGPEFSVEAISRSGVHEIVEITEKFTSGAPGFLEIGHVMPARLPEEVKERIRQVVITMLDHIGQDTGPTHTEIRIRDEQPYIIESQTRFGGDQIWEMADITKGVHFPNETVAALLGQPAPVRPVRAPAASIVFFLPPAGTLRATSGVDTARRQDNIIRVNMNRTPGDELPVIKGSLDRSGYVLATGDTPDHALSHAQRCADMIEFDVIKAVEV